MALAKLGEVEFDLMEEETLTVGNVITEKPVESSATLNDHVNNTNDAIEIKGRIVTDAARKISLLRGYVRERTLLSYTGRNAVNNVVIESLPTTHTVENLLGFDFTLVLRKIRFGNRQTAETQIDTSKLVIPQVKKVTSKGKQGTTSVGGNVDLTALLDKVRADVENIARDTLPPAP